MSLNAIIFVLRTFFLHFHVVFFSPAKLLFGWSFKYMFFHETFMIWSQNWLNEVWVTREGWVLLCVVVPLAGSVIIQWSNLNCVSSTGNCRGRWLGEGEQRSAARWICPKSWTCRSSHARWLEPLWRSRRQRSSSVLVVVLCRLPKNVTNSDKRQKCILT